MSPSKTSALAKLTPEKRKEVIDLAANMALLNHIKAIVDKSRNKENQEPSSSVDQKQS
ncbi:hypothetical protein [Nitrosospira sp. Nsp1]|uniref:hypothetical protein n=1 Tax=Nitrosospira sp. Nsp1 TaxID=136547 RepID=UPI0015A422E4|nr:hypothetical protein [Nitrosospira sp. Nsp1]